MSYGKKFVARRLLPLRQSVEVSVGSVPRTRSGVTPPMVPSDIRDAILPGSGRPSRGDRRRRRACLAARSALVARREYQGRGSHPEQAISVTEWGPLAGPAEYGQLLAEREVLERHSSASTADECQGPEHDDEGGQHALSWRATDAGINPRHWRSDSGEGRATKGSGGTR